ncbi:MAG TPA: LysR substrate-binding domain-containing protein [Acidobacteriaceae bacterium]|jgi:DNA-binding transcriptional LysR family regulator
MHIDFLGLQAFVAIAERGSFHRAAAHLNLSQTALSHRIRKLEDDLAVKLLSRTTREVSLTAAGLTLLPKVKDTIESLSISLDELRSEAEDHRDSLSIGCLPTMASGLLPKAIRRFAARNPTSTVHIYDNTANEIRELLRANAIAFGITFVSAQSSDFDIETLIEDPFMLLCPKDHPLASQPSVSWSKLVKEPLIRISQQTGNRTTIDDELGSRREAFTWRFEVQHLQTAVAMVRSGVALTVIPSMALPAGGESDLRLVPMHNPRIHRKLGIVSLRSAPLSPLADELRKIIIQVVAETKITRPRRRKSAKR